MFWLWMANHHHSTRGSCTLYRGDEEFSNTLPAYCFSSFPHDPNMFNQKLDRKPSCLILSIMRRQKAIKQSVLFRAEKNMPSVTGADLGREEGIDWVATHPALEEAKNKELK